MKKLLFFILCVSFFQSAQGMLVEIIQNGITNNKFLSDDGIVGANIAQAPFLTFGTYYIYNDFGTYVEEMSEALNATVAPPSFVSEASDSVDKTLTSWMQAISEIPSGTVEAQSITAQALASPEDYPAVGIYQLELSTCQAVIDDYNASSGIVTPNPDPVEGQVKLVARLRYNGGATTSQDTTQEIFLWSHHAICLSPTDRFNIVLSNDADTTSVTLASSESESSVTTVSSALSSYFQYGDHTISDCPAYLLATDSPRKVRLELA